jgi:hypothetical protein
MSLTLDTSTFTVGMLIDLVAKKHFSFNRPTIDATPLNDGTAREQTHHRASATRARVRPCAPLQRTSNHGAAAHDRTSAEWRRRFPRTHSQHGRGSHFADSDQLAEGAELDPIEEKDEIEKYARYRGMTLASLPKAVVNGCLLKIDDATQGDLTITLRVHHAVIDPEAAPLGFLCAGAVAAAPEPEPAAGASGASKRVLDKPQSPPDGSGNPGKRPRVIEEDLDDCVMLD